MPAERHGRGPGAAVPLLESIPPVATLVVLGGVGWALTVARGGAMGAGPGTMGMAFPLFMGMWGAMMAAMMLPALGPLAVRERVGGDARSGVRRVPGAVAFGAGFLVPWVAYGAAAFLAASLTGRLADASPGAGRWVGVGIIAAAGLYQFSPWKRWALEHCRMPWGGDRSAAAGRDLRAGVVDGAVCVVCCWVLMTVLFATGVMNLGVMAGLAAVILAEKVLPRPRTVALVAGLALLAFAAVAAWHPALLHGLMMPSGEMPMGGM